MEQPALVVANGDSPTEKRKDEYYGCIDMLDVFAGKPVNWRQQ